MTRQSANGMKISNKYLRLTSCEGLKGQVTTLEPKRQKKKNLRKGTETHRELGGKKKEKEGRRRRRKKKKEEGRSKKKESRESSLVHDYGGD